VVVELMYGLATLRRSVRQRFFEASLIILALHKWGVPGISRRLPIRSNLMKRYLHLALAAMLPTLALGCQGLNAAVDLPSVARSARRGSSSRTRTTCHCRRTIMAGSSRPSWRRWGQRLRNRGVEPVQRPHRDGAAPGAGAALVSQAGESGALRSAAVDAAELSPSGDGGDPDGRRAAADHGGYRIEFIVRKELEDVPRPVRSTVGGRYSAPRHGGAPDRVIDATIYEPTWIYRGRDQAMDRS